MPQNQKQMEIDKPWDSGTMVSYVSHATARFSDWCVQPLIDQLARSKRMLHRPAATKPGGDLRGH